MSSEVVRPQGSAFDMFKAADTELARYEAGQFAVNPIPVPGFKYPVPPLFFDLPWNDDDDEIQAGILAQLASAADIDAATAAKELTDPYDILGKPVTILGVSARMSDVEDAKWGAYMVLTCSVDNGAPEAITTGAGEVCVLVWRRFCEGRMPIGGSFVLRGSPKTGRKQPLGFEVEDAF